MTLLWAVFQPIQREEKQDCQRIVQQPARAILLLTNSSPGWSCDVYDYVALSILFISHKTNKWFDWPGSSLPEDDISSQQSGSRPAFHHKKLVWLPGYSYTSFKLITMLIGYNFFQSLVHIHLKSQVHPPVCCFCSVPQHNMQLFISC